MRQTIETSRLRSQLFLGESWEALEGSSVLVAGCGADGSHAAVQLAMTLNGAKDVSILVTDPDTFENENLGIQVCSMRSLGTNKAEATAHHLRDHYTGVNIAYNCEGVTLDNVDNLLSGVDVVIDAIDIAGTGISSTLHRKAAERNIPVIVPWSLGMGAAAMSCTEIGQFDEWGEQAARLAEQHGLERYRDIARWLVYLPPHLTMTVIDGIISGDLPTPTTPQGAQAGGIMAARLTLAELHVKNGSRTSGVTRFPTAVVTTSHEIIPVAYKQKYTHGIEDSLKELADR